MSTLKQTKPTAMTWHWWEHPLPFWWWWFLSNPNHIPKHILLCIPRIRSFVLAVLAQVHVANKLPNLHALTWLLVTLSPLSTVLTRSCLPLLQNLRLWSIVSETLQVSLSMTARKIVSLVTPELLWFGCCFCSSSSQQTNTMPVVIVKGHSVCNTNGKRKNVNVVLSLASQPSSHKQGGWLSASTICCAVHDVQWHCQPSLIFAAQVGVSEGSEFDPEQKSFCFCLGMHGNRRFRKNQKIRWKTTR